MTSLLVLFLESHKHIGVFLGCLPPVENILSDIWKYIERMLAEDNSDGTLKSKEKDHVDMLT